MRGWPISDAEYRKATPLVDPHDRLDARRVGPRVRLAMRILEFEQTRVPSIDRLADRVGMSPFHLSRMFASQLGESCAAYSRRIRLDCSNNQMIHAGVPLEIVAATFGYASQTAFTPAYTRQFGMPPKRFIATVLGRSGADHAAGHLDPIDGAAIAPPLLREAVRVVGQPSRRALVRRFHGYDLDGHWRRFLAELPFVPDGIPLAGMSFDNARVTPGRHWRYDCAAVIDDAALSMWAGEDTAGLDLVDIPGGHHAEVRSAAVSPISGDRPSACLPNGCRPIPNGSVHPGFAQRPVQLGGTGGL